MGKLQKLRTFLNARRKLSLILLAAFLIAGVFFWRQFPGNKAQPQYQTAKVEKGTLVSSVSESGQVVVSNKLSVTTQASGIIEKVSIKNGDTVAAGDKIASVILDQAGQQRQAQAWSAYLGSQNSFNAANNNLYSLQSTMFSKWKTYIDIAQNSTYQNFDSSPNTTNRVLTPFTIAQDDWLAAEAAYKNQQGVIAQTQASLNSAWLSYQTASSVISAPMAGTIGDLIISPGMQIGVVQSQAIAYILKEGNPVISVNLSEIDVTKVKAGNKATVVFDALPNKTFTGKVVGINTTGVISSGVTTYPATIVLDSQNDSILSNMSATASIITEVKDDVFLIPSAAVQTQNGQSAVRVLNKGVISQVSVEVGASSDTQTEIISGLNGQEEVVISVITGSQGNSSTSRSPFSGGFGGGTLRPGGR